MLAALDEVSMCCAILLPFVWTVPLGCQAMAASPSRPSVLEIRGSSLTKRSYSCASRMVCACTRGAAENGHCVLMSVRTLLLVPAGQVKKGLRQWASDELSIHRGGEWFHPRHRKLSGKVWENKVFYRNTTHKQRVTLLSRDSHTSEHMGGRGLKGHKLHLAQ